MTALNSDVRILMCHFLKKKWPYIGLESGNLHGFLSHHHWGSDNHMVGEELNFILAFSHLITRCSGGGGGGSK